MRVCSDALPFLSFSAIILGGFKYTVVYPWILLYIERLTLQGYYQVMKWLAL